MKNNQISKEENITRAVDRALGRWISPEELLRRTNITLSAQRGARHKFLNNLPGGLQLPYHRIGKKVLYDWPQIEKLIKPATQKTAKKEG